MLSCIRRAFDLMREQGLGDHQLTVDMEAQDEAVYNMLCKGDSIGVFQVESRAQINMLPRLKPRSIYDQIGRASCREGGCQYVYISVVAEQLKKKKTNNTTHT